VVKADGLAAVKASSLPTPRPRLRRSRWNVEPQDVGAAGERVVLENSWNGEELSFL